MSILSDLKLVCFKGSQVCSEILSIHLDLWNTNESWAKIREHLLTCRASPQATLTLMLLKIFENCRSAEFVAIARNPS